MILIVNPHIDAECRERLAMREHECPLHVTLRRMGFHAARAPRQRPRTLAQAASAIAAPGGDRDC